MKKNPGPGTYDTSSYDEWNKKSHNILVFIFYIYNFQRTKKIFN